MEEQKIPILNNASEHKFENISSEAYRTYVFPNGNVTIFSPLELAVTKSGSHRILSLTGISHYIPTGWLHLYWKAKDGSPHFVK